MKKLKTVRSLSKRVKRTATGRFVRRRGGLNHNLGSKSNRRKRHLHTPTALNRTEQRRARRMLPGS